MSDNNPIPMRYKYYTKTLRDYQATDPSDITECLNNLAASGWEYVNSIVIVVPGSYGASKVVHLIFRKPDPVIPKEQPKDDKPPTEF